MKVFAVFFLLLFALSVNAQVSKKESEVLPNPIKEAQFKVQSFQRLLDKMGVTVKTPSNYTRYNARLPFFCYSSSMQFGFVNKDSSVFIGIALMATDSAYYKRDKEIGKILRPDLPNYDPNDQWWIGFKGSADSTFFKPVLYASKKLTKYNAENGVEFYKACRDLFLNRYRAERVIRLNKKYKGIIEIHYFLKVGAKNDIDKLVKDGAKMVFYNK